MSKISLIYDALVDFIEAKIPGYQRIPNPYIAEQNTELYLRKGYGIAVGPATPTNRFVSCLESVQRDFTVLLIKQITTTDHNIDQREVLEKNILEDHFTLIKALVKEPTLNGNSIKTVYAGDSGVLFLENDRNKYFLIEINLSSEYLEDIT